MSHLTVIIDPELDMDQLPDWMEDDKLEWLSTSSNSEMRMVYNFYVNDLVVFQPNELDWLDIPYDDYCVSIFKGRHTDVIDRYMNLTETRRIAFIKRDGKCTYVVLIPKTRR